MKMISVIRVSLVFLLLVAANGCATKALWDNTKNFNQPAPNPNLHLYFAEQQKDFLVVYDECFGRKGSIRQRAYFLFQNEEQKKRRVNFANTNLVAGYAAVPMFLKTPVCIPAPQFYVVAETNAVAFQLCSSNDVLGTYRLPVYNDGTGKYERMAFVPLAVAADATIWGGIMAIEAFCQGGGLPGKLP